MASKANRIARASRRLERKAIAARWKRCAEIPEIKKICRKLIGGYALGEELQSYANQNPIKISQALAFLGIRFAVVQNEGVVSFQPSWRPGGSKQDAVLRECEKQRPVEYRAGPNIRRPRTQDEGPGQGLITAFYKSRDWAQARYEALVRSRACCVCCGSSSLDGAVLRVDHVKPLRVHWDLRLEQSNLQVLCNRCNWGKGSWDETDWRYGTKFPTQSRNEQEEECSA